MKNYILYYLRFYNINKKKYIIIKILKLCSLILAFINNILNK